MEIIPEKLGLTKAVKADEPLPMRYVNEVIDSDVLFGRMMGLMAQISLRTDKPITFDDEILKSDNILLHGFIRVASVITKEEQRVLEALLDERKWMRENHSPEVSNDVLRAIYFVEGWKLEANRIFASGGNMYDLLVFSDHDFILSRSK